MPNVMEQAERYNNCLNTGYERMRELYTEQKTRPVNPEATLASLEEMNQLAQTQEVAAMSAKSVTAQYYSTAFDTSVEYNTDSKDVNDIRLWIDQCCKCGQEGRKQ